MYRRDYVRLPVAVKVGDLRLVNSGSQHGWGGERTDRKTSRRGDVLIDLHTTRRKNDLGFPVVVEITECGKGRAVGQVERRGEAQCTRNRRVAKDPGVVVSRLNDIDLPVAIEIGCLV